ncbi:hypothetical protein [Raoultella terrigena]|uniref:hypothetical protein n=1 Tax=Raoultella terrigena TaxID=577 RepID=UPI00384D7174
MPATFPHSRRRYRLIRDKRQLHPQEWYETPKPSLTRLAEYAIIRERAIAAAEQHHEQ